MAEGRSRGRGRRKKGPVGTGIITPEEHDENINVISVQKREVKEVTKVKLPESGPTSILDPSPLKKSSTATHGVGRTSQIFPEDGEDRNRPESMRDSPQASISQRIQEVTGHVVDTLTSGLPSAANFVTKSQLGWALGTLLCTMLLSGWTLLRFAQPYVSQRQLNDIVRNIEEADRQYQHLLKQLDDTRNLQDYTEGRVEKALARLRELETEWAGLDALKHPRVTDDTDVKLEGMSNEILRRAEEKLSPQLQQSISTINADRTGRPDYAAHASGGRVVGHSHLFRAMVKPWWFTLEEMANDWFPFLPAPVHPIANKWILSPGGTAAECLALNGTSGWVDIRLRTVIWPQALTLEHIPEDISFEPRSAPRECTVWGWSTARRLHNGQVERTHAGDLRKHRIGSFVFDQKHGSLQTFTLANDLAVDHIRFEVNSNHGQPLYTCIYRVRVHGLAVAGADYSTPNGGT